MTQAGKGKPRPMTSTVSLTLTITHTRNLPNPDADAIAKQVAELLTAYLDPSTHSTSDLSVTATVRSAVIEGLVPMTVQAVHNA